MFVKGRSTVSHTLSRLDGPGARRHFARRAKRQPGWSVRTVAGLVFLLSVFGCQVAAAQPLPRSVLVVDPADVRGPFYYGIFSALRSVLTAGTGVPVTLYSESLDLSRFGGPDYEASLRNHFAMKYRDKPIGVVVAIGTTVLDYVLRIRTEIWPGVPVVFAMVDEPTIAGRNLPADVTGTLVRLRFDDMMTAAHAVEPTLARVVLVGDRLEQSVWQHFAGEIPAALGGVELTDLTGMKFRDVLARLAAQPDDSVILYTGIYSDGEGTYFPPADAIARLAEAANRPIVVTAETFVGPGIGGFVMMPSVIGREAAQLALRILGGEPAASIPIAVGNSVRPVFDWRQLRRWNVSESRLPPGSDVRFREPSAWERYRFQVVVAFAVVLLQAAMIGWLLHEHRRRVRSEEAAHELSGRIINAGEQERARLARELHDDVTQRLALLAIDAGREERHAAGGAGALAMRSMREGLVRLSQDVHALSYRLHPSMLEDLGLVEALQSECERFSRVCPTRLAADRATIPAEVPNDVALCLFRVAQEALRNAGRHANASRADVRLERLDGGLELVVTDDGIGFDATRRRNGASLGHASMRQRVVQLGGTLEIDSSPGRGTVVQAWVPLKEKASGTSTRTAG